ncbi:MAG: hypothetical protein ACMUJM_08720 [bacterium]
MKRVILKVLVLCLPALMVTFIYSINAHGFLAPEGKRDQRYYRALKSKEEKILLYSLAESDQGKFGSLHGSEWKVIVDPLKDMATRIYGGKASLGIDTGSYGLHNYLTQDTLISSCKEFINQNHSLFKVKTTDLELVKVVDKTWIRHLHFRQRYEEKVVYGSYLSFIINKGGDIISINMNLFPDIYIENLSNFDLDECQTIIEDDLQGDKYEQISQEIVVYPQYSDSGGTYVLAGCFEIKSRRPLHRWRYIIDLHDMRIIEKNDLAHYMISGSVMGKILPRYYNDTEKEEPLVDLKISLLQVDSPLYYNSLNEDPGWGGIMPGYGWEFGRPLPLSGSGPWPDPDSGHTGSSVYGYNLTGAYPLSMEEPDYLTMSQHVDCSQAEQVGLMFWRWLGIEGSREDRATIEIWDEATAMWKKIWNNGRGDIYDGAWRLMFYDISQWASAHETVWLRWGMGPTSEYLSYCGWNIDDIGIYSTIEDFSDKYGQFSVKGENNSNILVAQLEGRYFRVINDKGANIIYSKSNIQRATHSHNFIFTKEDNYNEDESEGVINALDDIDEINVYYHTNEMIHYIQDIDPDFLSSGKEAILPINITVRYNNKFNNAFWLLGEGIFFGEGDGFEFRNFSHFADIIYHEVNHAITDSIYGYLNTSYQREIGGFDEFDAMHEAFSDYWACTVTDDSKIAEGGFWIFSPHDYVRNLENNFNFRFDYGYELYESSLILSGAMWDLRQNLKEESGAEGVRIADTLFHFAREAEAKTYRDFLIDIFLVDELKYENAHEKLILDIFGAKGISLPPLPPSSITVEEASEGVTIRWTKSPEAAGYCIYYQEQSSLYLNKEKKELSVKNDIRLDVGDRNSYLLTGLSKGEYIIKLTSYNKYGVESISSAERRLVLNTSLSTSADEPWEAGYIACFLNTL